MRRVSIVLTVMLSAACGDLAHESPFDPQTPPDKQARTSFAGTVSLESVGGVVTPGLSGIQVSLAGTGYSAATDVSGRYVIGGVPAGAYTVQAVLPNYETTSVSGMTATLDTGGTVVGVPTLALRRVRADLAGTVELLLPDASLEQVGGTSVSLEGAAAPAAPLGGAGLFAARLGATTTALGTTAGSTLTDGNGAFVIPNVPAGTYTLNASRVGYGVDPKVVTFVDGAFVVQTLRLPTVPGAITGSVLVVGAVDASGV